MEYQQHHHQHYSATITSPSRPPITKTLRALGTPIHRGRSQQLWLVEVRDAAERLVARGQVRLQNAVPAGGSVE